MTETNSSQPRIMIVEDESIVALDLQGRLRRMDYEVVALAASAKTAVAKAKETKPDLILMDIQLKGEVDGIAAAASILVVMDVPIIFLTAYADEPTLQRAKKITPYGYLLKPFQEAELHTTIATAIYRHQMERKLKENERWLQTTLSSIGDAVIAAKSDGHIHFMNAQAADLTGWEVNEALGKDIKRVFNVENRKREPLIARPFTGSLVTPLAAEPSYQMFLLHRDGDKVTPIEHTTTAIKDENGRSQGVVIVFRDVSEQRQLEDTIRQYTYELRARNDELDAFAHTAAHDLQSPLAPIIGLVEIVETGYKTMPDEELQTYFQAIRRSGRKMLNIIDELITLSQVRKADVSTKPLDMTSIVHEATERIHHLSEEYKAQITTASSWPIALGHGPWIEEVWVNYISNAIKYGGRPPRIELGAEQIASDLIRFWVKDNGNGLLADQQEQVFAPFTQLQQVRRGGSGLGLSIVRRIVEKLDGQVGVESEPGEGCVFSFTLPAAPSLEVEHLPNMVNGGA